MAWYEKNKIRLILSIASLLCAGFYIYFRPPTNSDQYPYKISGLRWLEAALLVALIMSIVPVLKGLFREKRWSELERRQQRGLKLGFIVYAALLGLFIYQWATGNISLSILLYILLAIAAAVTVVDKLLNLPGWVIELDVIVFVTLLLTTVIVKHVFPIFQYESDYFVGFHSGAAAFQLILVNLLFDPKLYTDIFTPISTTPIVDGSSTVKPHKRKHRKRTGRSRK